MKSNHIKSLLLASALLMPLSGFAADSDSVKTELKDSVITTKIKAGFAKDKLVSATQVKVETDNAGVVKLSGTAKTKAEADQAVTLAKNVKGVTSVENNIQIKADE